MTESILLNPLPYLPFLRLMDLSHIVLTDSGGLQEEARESQQTRACDGAPRNDRKA